VGTQKERKIVKRIERTFEDSRPESSDLQKPLSTKKKKGRRIPYRTSERRGDMTKQINAQITKNGGVKRGPEERKGRGDEPGGPRAKGSSREAS